MLWHNSSNQLTAEHSCKPRQDPDNSRALKRSATVWTTWVITHTLHRSLGPIGLQLNLFLKYCSVVPPGACSKKTASIAASKQGLTFSPCSDCTVCTVEPPHTHCLVHSRRPGATARGAVCPPNHQGRSSTSVTQRQLRPFRAPMTGSLGRCLEAKRFTSHSPVQHETGPCAGHSMRTPAALAPAASQS